MLSENFIQSLLDQTTQIINQVEKLKSYDLHTLMWREHDNSWSILE